TARLVAAWGEPAAWAGTARVGGSLELPAEVVGHMLLAEFVVHGWDLGQAIGHRVEWDHELLRRLLDGVTRMADQARAMGAFGPEVPVPDSAPTLDRLLGMTGRVPARR
ncbi:TIGR03086 family metal-binding protein, partial [Saccharothrix coeruleofusca]